MFSVSSPHQILNSPINDSISKQHYSFSKSDRFPPIKSYCAKSFYESPTIRPRRAGIGYGNKSDFTTIP